MRFWRIENWGYAKHKLEICMCLVWCQEKFIVYERLRLDNVLKCMDVCPISVHSIQISPSPDRVQLIRV